MMIEELCKSLKDVSNSQSYINLCKKGAESKKLIIIFHPKNEQTSRDLIMPEKMEKKV